MPTARTWREYPKRYRYEAAICKKCGKWFFPARLICDKCGHREFETKNMGRFGTVLTHTVIRIAPAPFVDQAPYAMAVVEMDDGPRITTQVVDLAPDQLKAGLKVKLEFRKISEDGHPGPINYGYKAVPV